MHLTRAQIYYTLLFCCWQTLNAVAQQDSIATKSNLLGDTSKVYYYTIDNPTLLKLIDSSLYRFEEVRAGWKTDPYYVDLGVLGSPGLDLLYRPKLQTGFRVGLEQYERYKMQRSDIRYYETQKNRPFSDLYYSQISQKNNLIAADFGHKLNSNLYLGLQYKMISQGGFFNHQRVRNQNVGLALRYTSSNQKYQGYFTFKVNSIKNENNGGVAVDTVANETTDFLTNIPVQSTSALSRYIFSDLTYTHFLYNKAADSTGKTRATNAWSHRISYQFNRYKFFDKQPTEALYSTAFVNPRGIRLFIRHQLIENELSFRQALGGNLSTAPLWLKPYVKYSLHLLHQEPIDFVVHNLSAGLLVQNNPQYKLKYRIQGQLTWNQPELDLLLKGRLGYDMGKLGLLEGKALFQRFQPSLIDRQLYVSWEQVWNHNAFKQQLAFNFGGSYSLKSIGLKAEVLNHTLSNWVYYDS